MPIITIIKQYLNAIIAVFVAVLTFYICSVYYCHKLDSVNNAFTNYRLTIENGIEKQKNNILEKNNKLNKESLALQDKIKELENENYKNYTALQAANASIKSNIADGTKRLYINAKCSTATNSGDTKTEDTTASTVANGSTGKAVINTEDAAAIIEITNEGDKYRSQVEGLQDYIKTILDNNK